MTVNGLKGDLSSSCLCWWWLNSCFEVQNLVCGPGLYFEDKHCNPTVNNMKYFPVILWVSEAGWPCLCKECLWSSYFFFPFLSEQCQTPPGKLQLSFPGPEVANSNLFLSLSLCLLFFNWNASGEGLWTLLPVPKQIHNERVQCLKTCWKVEWIFSANVWLCLNVYTWWQKYFQCSLILPNFSFDRWFEVFEYAFLFSGYIFF